MLTPQELSQKTNEIFMQNAIQAKDNILNLWNVADDEERILIIKYYLNKVVYELAMENLIKFNFEK